MAIQPTIATARLVLRPFLLDDAAAVQRLAGARQIAATTLNIPHPYEDGMAEAWIGGHRQAWDRGEQAAFAITQSEAGLVGAIGLRIEAAHQRAELGYWIGVPYWNRGYATEAAGAVLEFAFGELGLHRVHASYLTANPASGRVMEKVGMKREGLRRDHILKWDEYHDLTICGLLREDFAARAAEVRA